MCIFETSRDSAQGAACPATPTSTPSDGTFSPDAPIQFDLTTPGGGTSPKGPPKYVVEHDSL